MNDIFDVKDKIVLVTGSGRGNGEAIAEGFLTRGAIVYGIEIEFRSDLDHKNYNKILFDVSQLEKIPSLVQEIYSNHQAIDVLINNAGVGLASDVPYSDEIFDQTFQVNLSKVISI
mgnify:FL=1